MGNRKTETERMEAEAEARKSSEQGGFFKGILACVVVIALLWLVSIIADGSNHIISICKHAGGVVSGNARYVEGYVQCTIVKSDGTITTRYVIDPTASSYGAFTPLQ